MNEFRKAFLVSFACIVLLCLWLSQELRLVGAHTGILIHGSLFPQSRVTNLEGLGLLLGGLFLVNFMLALLGFRRLTYRESGGMLAHGQREIPELRGMETFQRRLQ